MTHAKTKRRAPRKTKKVSFFSRRHVKPAIAAAFIVAVGGIASILIARAATPSPIEGTAIPETNYTPPTTAIYIAPNGNDKNTGTKTSPIKTISRAVAIAPNGGTVVLRGGVYRDGSNNSINKKLTWQAYPREQVWLDGTNIVNGWKKNGNAWYIDNWSTPSFCNNQYYSYPYNKQKSDNTGPCSHIDMTKDPKNPMAGSPQMVFVNGRYIHEVASKDQVANNFYYDKSAKRLYLGVDPSGKTIELAARPTAFRFTSGAAGTVVRGIGFRKYASNEYSGNATHGAVLANNATGIVFENTTFTQNAGSGLFFATSASAIVRASYFINNGFNGFDANGHHVGKGVADNLSIQGNTFKGNNTEYFGAGCSLSCASGGVKLAHMAGFTLKNNVFEKNIGKGFWCDLYCDSATIVNNIFRNNTDTGLYYEVSRNAIIASNLIYGNGGYGYKGGSGNVKFYNNTLVNNKTNLLIYDDSRKPSGSEIAPDTTNVDVANNILSGGEMLKAWKGQTGANQFFVGLDYNSYYRPNNTPRTLVEWRATTGTKTYATLAAFRGATGREVHGHDITSGNDPFFVNASKQDYRLRSDSVASKSGKPLPADVAKALGLPSGAKPDRGAIAWPGKL